MSCRLTETPKPCDEANSESLREQAGGPPYASLLR